MNRLFLSVIGCTTCVPHWHFKIQNQNGAFIFFLVDLQKRLQNLTIFCVHIAGDIKQDQRFELVIRVWTPDNNVEEFSKFGL